jgi:hypothetical protein
MKLEFVNAIPELVGSYENVVKTAILTGLITEEEWNERFKFFRDDAGYSFVHYLTCVLNNKMTVFLTENPVMIEHRGELQKRFGVKIINLKEFMEMNKNE